MALLWIFVEEVKHPSRGTFAIATGKQIHQRSPQRHTNAAVLSWCGIDVDVCSEGEGDLSEVEVVCDVIGVGVECDVGYCGSCSCDCWRVVLTCRAKNSTSGGKMGMQLLTKACQD